MNRRSTQLLLAATALAAPALLSACSGDASAEDRAGTSTGSGAGSVRTDRAVTVEHLLTDDDTVYSEGADWFRTSAHEGDGQSVFHPCATRSLEGTGATSVARADFELRNLEDPTAEVTGDFLTQVVGEYDDEASARGAYDEIGAWLAECTQRPAGITDYTSFEPRVVDVDGATAQIVDSHYGPVPAELDPYGDEANIMETGIALSGSRVTVLTSVIVGQDYNFLDEDGGTPVNRMLPVAVDRLRSL